jgi:hypothetical protein
MTAQESFAPNRWPRRAGLVHGVRDLWQRKDRLRQVLSWSYLFAPVDTASLAVVRIAMGLLVAIDALRKGQGFFYPSDGRLLFSFRYQFFHWLQESPELSVYLPYVLFVAGIAVAIGFFFRFFSLVCLFLVTYGFLLQPENYLNHYYMLIIILFLLSISPAHRSFSADRFLLFRSSSEEAPRIYLLLFKAQIEIILIYAGLVKINSDWLQLEPLRTWLVERQHAHVLGFLWQSDIIVALGAYGTILLHVLGAPLLFFRRTRLPVFLTYCVFHITNHFVFDIGIFPWMTIVCSTLFFAADWPRRAMGMLWPTLASSSPFPDQLQIRSKSFGNGMIIAFCVAWLLFQSLFPLRHLLYPGWVEWTNEGHRFAWRMKLTDHSSAGVLLAAHIPEQGKVRVPNLPRYMTRRQYHIVSVRPDLVQQLAWQVARLYKEKLQVGDVKVFAHVSVSMNNRRHALMIDPTIDLAATQPTIWHAPWITLTNPNPLRRIEQKEKEPSLTLHRILLRMGLTEEKDCIAGGTHPDLHELAVCSPVSQGLLDSQW